MKKTLFLFMIFTIFLIAEEKNVNLININGLMHKIEDSPYTGKVVKYYENGKKKFKGFYKNGVMDKEWSYYYESGELYKKEVFVNGELKSVKYFFKDGKESDLPVILSKLSNFYVPVKDNNLKVKVGSHIKSYKNNNYDAEMLVDGNVKTAWVPLKIKKSFFILNFKDDMEGEGYGIIFYNGYQKSQKIWKYNSRIKLMKVYLNGKPMGYVYLKDTPKPQRVAVKTNDTGKLKFEILSVYKGEKYPKDVALSEIKTVDYSDCIRGDETENELFCCGESADDNGYCLQYSYCGDFL